MPASDDAVASAPLLCAAACGDEACMAVLVAHGGGVGVGEAALAVERLHGYERADAVRALLAP